MSRSLELRQVEQHVNVFRCDRCGTELARCEKYGVSQPGEGSSLSVQAYQREKSRTEWLPLRQVDIADRNAVSNAATPDLCPSCTESLMEWFAAV